MRVKGRVKRFPETDLPISAAIGEVAEIEIPDPEKQKYGYKYFENRSCPFYPCHNLESINCLFCFCPLFDRKCWMDKKDCENCIYPHVKSNYQMLINKLCNI
jgi:Zn-finger protein